MIFWEFYGEYGIRRAFYEAKECKIWTSIVGVIMIKGILIIEGKVGNTKNFFKYIFRKF
jgi:hypothetical protein